MFVVTIVISLQWMQDGHLGGQFLRFGPKWVINITKLGIQIHSFWQNSRPLRPKMALLAGIIEIERAVFVFGRCFDTWKEDIWGKQNQKRHFCTHCYIATLERKIFEAGALAKAHTSVSLFLCNFTAVWNICAPCCIPTLQRKTFVKSPYQVMKFCAWLPLQHSKDDFC